MSKSSEIEVTPGTPTRLPDTRCRFVLLSNRNYELGKNEIIEDDVNWDNYKTSNNEIYYGYSAETPHPLFPSETTILLPVANANEIFLRVQSTVVGGLRFVAYTIIH